MVKTLIKFKCIQWNTHSHRMNQWNTHSNPWHMHATGHLFSEKVFLSFERIRMNGLPWAKPFREVSSQEEPFQEALDRDPAGPSFAVE